MNDSACAYMKTVSSTRFVLLSIGTVLASIGVCFNVILVFVFWKKNRKQPVLGLLALFDCVLCMCYVLLFGAEGVAFHLKVKLAHEALFTYVLYAFFASRVSQFAIPALLIIISVQKLANLIQQKGRISRLIAKNETGLISSVVLTIFGIAIRCPMLASLYIKTFPNCPDFFLSKEIWPTDFYFMKPLPEIRMILNLAQVFVPFFLLLAINAAIVYKLRTMRQRRKRDRAVVKLVRSLSVHRTSRRRKEGARLARRRSSIVTAHLEAEMANLRRTERLATYTTVVIVGLYLLCNSLHLPLTILETWFAEWLTKGTGWNDLYIYGSDSISVLFMCSSAGRLLVHRKFNPVVRAKLKKLLCCF